MGGTEKKEVENRIYILAHLFSVASKSFSSTAVCFIVPMEMLKAEIYSLRGVIKIISNHFFITGKTGF